MSDRYVEKNFLYLLVLSVLLHLGVYQLIALIPPDKPKAAQETTIVDLADIPTLAPEHPKVVRPEPEKKQQEVKRYAEKRQRFQRETAPKGEHELARPVPPRPLPVPSLPAPARPQAPATARPQAPTTTRPQATAPRKGETGAAREPGVAEPSTRGDGIFKPKSADGSGKAKLFPSASRLASLEENYRKKYGPEVEDGEAMFLNTDDIRFGSFLRRLETAVYGVWQYPQEALMRGIEGTTPVRITFNRKGEIVHVELLETSGSGILDSEVLRTLKQLGPIGSFPKGYTRETFKLIAFFHYGINGSRLR